MRVRTPPGKGFSPRRSICGAKRLAHLAGCGLPAAWDRSLVPRAAVSEFGNGAVDAGEGADTMFMLGPDGVNANPRSEPI
jgi:hypothetical protein